MATEPKPQPKHKVIISGTGRAGTTFLVKMMTAVGLDTGVGDGMGKVYDTANAGLEIHWDHPEAPYILKSPAFCDHIGPLLDEGRFIVDHAFIPMRALDEAVASRERVSQQTKQKFWRRIRGRRRAPGGLWETDNPSQQPAILAIKFHQLLHDLTRHDVPITFLEFPRLVKDAAYLYAKLKPILGNVTFAEFDKAFQATARPDMVHSFKATPPGN